MSTALAIAGWSVFGLMIVAGFLLNLIGLFGNWLILGAIAIAGWLTGFEHFGGWTIPILLAIAIAGELGEFFASGVGAKRFGGSKGSIGAALAGCILGAIAGSPIFPIIGTVIGACVGAFLAAATYEYLMIERSLSESAYTGFGAALGKVGGMFLKAGCGVVMIVIAALTF